MNSRILGIILLVVFLAGSLLYFGNRDSNVITAKSKLVTDINRKSDVTEPWNLQPRWYDTSRDVLVGLDDDSYQDTLPIMKGVIKSTENIFTCDFSMSYDPLKRPLKFTWYVDGVDQQADRSIFIVTLSKDSAHSIMLSLSVPTDNKDDDYSIGTGFYEIFDLKTAFSETSPLDIFAK